MKYKPLWEDINAAQVVYILTQRFINPQRKFKGECLN